MMMGFTFKGRHSSEFGIKVLDEKKQGLPEMGDQFLEVPMRHGSIVKNAAFKDRTVIQDCLIFDELFDEVNAMDIRLENKITEIVGWLYSRNFEDLILDTEPDKIYRAKVSNTIDIVQDLIKREFSVEFRCYPFKFALTQDVLNLVVGLADNVFTIDAGNFEAIPLFKVTGHGGIFNMTVNGNVFEYNDLAEVSAIYIDTENVMVYAIGSDGKKVRKEHKFKGIFPVLKDGSNKVSCSRNVNLEITYKKTYL
jgi:predicted phage tail component-like protein